MPYKEFIVQKVYFSVSEVSQRLEEETGYRVDTSTLRFWEKDMALYVPRKGGHRHDRKYREADYEMFRLVTILRFDYGLTPGGIRDLIHKSGHKQKLIDVLTHNKLNNGKS